MIRSGWLAYKAQEFSCLYFIPPPTRLVFQAYPASSFWHGLWRVKFSMCNQACTPKTISPNLLLQHSAQTFKSSLLLQSIGISVLWLAFRDTSSSHHHSCSLPHLLAVSLPSSQHGKRGGGWILVIRSFLALPMPGNAVLQDSSPISRWLPATLSTSTSRLHFIVLHITTLFSCWSFLFLHMYSFCLSSDPVSG